MGRRKIPTTIYITAEQELALKRLSQRTKVPIAEYVRQGIDLVLAQNGDALPGQLSFEGLASGLTDELHEPKK